MKEKEEQKRGKEVGRRSERERLFWTDRWTGWGKGESGIWKNYAVWKSIMKRRGRNRMRKMNRKVEDEEGEWGTGR